MSMLKQLLSVFLESRCAFCDRNTAKVLCSYCETKLTSHSFKPENCQIASSDLPVFAWGKYDGHLRRAISLMKYDQQPEIGKLLGKLLASAWLESQIMKPPHKLTIVPIPLHDQRLKERGFNQAQVIAKGFCQMTGHHLNSQVLVRMRNTKAMFELNSEERVANLQNAFELGRQLPKYPVLLLDDIYTTGTTIKESIKVLKQNQVKVFGTVVVATGR